MARKTYISRNTIPHFSVGDRRVAFHPSSMGNSFFTTADPVLQKRMEAHPWYKKKFMLHSVEEDEEAPSQPPRGEEQGNKELAEMHFDTLADAKNYLATEFGAVRSNIRTTENAISIGKANGVKVVISPLPASPRGGERGKDEKVKM